VIGLNELPHNDGQDKHAAEQSGASFVEPVAEAQEKLGKELTEQDFLKLTSEELKACHGCKHRIRDNGHISRQAKEERGIVYGCCFSQSKLYKELAYLPDSCRAKNVEVNMAHIQTIPDKIRDNCQVCTVMKEGKPVCKTEGIKNVVCPCKACPKFMRNDKGCMNFTPECQEAFKYERIILDTTI
jgi:hypothetical protein